MFYSPKVSFCETRSLIHTFYCNAKKYWEGPAAWADVFCINGSVLSTALVPGLGPFFLNLRLSLSNEGLSALKTNIKSNEKTYERLLSQPTAVPTARLPERNFLKWRAHKITFHENQGSTWKFNICSEWYTWKQEWPLKRLKSHLIDCQCCSADTKKMQAEQVDLSPHFRPTEERKEPSFGRRHWKFNMTQSVSFFWLVTQTSYSRMSGRRK